MFPIGPHSPCLREGIAKFRCNGWIRGFGGVWVRKWASSYFMPHTHIWTTGTLAWTKSVDPSHLSGSALAWTSPDSGNLFIRDSARFERRRLALSTRVFYRARIPRTHLPRAYRRCPAGCSATTWFSWAFFPFRPWTFLLSWVPSGLSSAWTCKWRGNNRPPWMGLFRFQ